MATWGSVPKADYQEAKTNEEVPPNSYFRLKQERKHLRTNFDWSPAQILKKIYDDAAAAGEVPKFISVVDTTPGDVMWANYSIDVVTYHKESIGDIVMTLAVIIVAAIVAYFLITSIYFIATGETVPPPGYQAIRNPKTGEIEIVPVGSYYDKDGNLITGGLFGFDPGTIMMIIFGLGGIYIAGKFIGRR
jgi:hypothetical protein